MLRKLAARKRRKSLKSNVFVSCRNVLLTDRARLMHFAPSVPSKKESAEPAGKKRKRRSSP